LLWDDASTPSTPKQEVRMRPIPMLIAVASLATGCSGDRAIETAQATPAPTTPTSATAAPVPLRESRAGLLARTAVLEAAARAAALRRVPGGTVVEAELEDEDGTLVYAYDIRLADGSGVMDVEVDALTRRVLRAERDDEDGSDDDDAPGARTDSVRADRRR
jgi:uncharacterized membrane protein YkoI